VKRIYILFLVGIISHVTTVQAADDGSVPLFNGKNFDGWVNVNCAPETWTVRDGIIVCTGIPTGVLRT